jgi:hypothetical protein
MSGPKGFDISGESEVLQKAFRDYSQYLVALALLERPKSGEPKSQFASGFVIEIGPDWYWVTAGHLLEVIEHQIAAGVYEQFRLIDCYGFGRDSNPVPFEYADAKRFHVYDEKAGLDFGAVALTPYYRDLLESNRVAVVTDSEWRRADYAAHDDYIVLGLPDDSIERTTRLGMSGGVVHGRSSKNISTTCWEHQQTLGKRRNRWNEWWPDFRHGQDRLAGEGRCYPEPLASRQEDHAGLPNQRLCTNDRAMDEELAGI